jgi:hypothetical protein
MPDLTANQRATRLVADFMNAEFEDPQHVLQWLFEHFAAAIEEAETAARRRDSLPLQASYSGHIEGKPF